MATCNGNRCPSNVPVTDKTQTSKVTTRDVYTCQCHNVKPPAQFQRNPIDLGNECACNAEGVLPRSEISWTSGTKIQLSQLTELVNAAKYELKIRNQTTNANNITTRPALDKVTIDDVNQMISKIESMRTAVPTVPTKKAVLYTDLTAMRSALRELQKECIAYVACTCNYCYCHMDCSCNCNRCTNDTVCSCNSNVCYQVGANAQVVCARVCSCNYVCNCYNVCSCYCNNCTCNYAGGCTTHSSSVQHNGQGSYVGGKHNEVPI